MEKVAENMAEVSPTVVVCVPRFFEKMYNAVVQNVNKGSSIKKKLFWWAIGVGKDHLAIENSKN